MRQGGVLYYIFGDHPSLTCQNRRCRSLRTSLGSTAVVKNTQGGKTELRYTAWGTTRYEYGSTPTDRRFTGQREVDDIGLYFYNARWYDPALGRFIQADTIVPGAGNPQVWDRYAYANNNPVKYIDPTGHYCVEEDNIGNYIKTNCESGEPIKNKKERQGIEFRFDLDDLPGTEDLYYSLSKIANWTALSIDANLEALAIIGAIIGYTSGAAWLGGTPVTGIPGAIIGWSTVQIRVQRFIQLGNIIALGATALGTIADDKAGNNEISLTIGLSSEGVYGDHTFRLSSSSQEAWALTWAGFQGQAQISETSLIVQTMAVLNDYGYMPPVPWGTINWTNSYSWP